ncbi:SDR family NAD(P)-dependent oxidoreductase [Trebonia kvetii]|uniref:SDR family NAD(P)-dependent oxidoreductase n=1 Tax=Trebonia kvetii TaxID=2480626 RepID=UPI002482F57A|nr:SDR family oxidoreductase [Trebonia kvetii]
MALVTGASRGIGMMIAIGLASRGAAVYAAARDSGRLNQLAAEPSAHDRITPLAVDLTSAWAKDSRPRGDHPRYLVPVRGLTGQVLTADGGRSIGTYHAPD